MGTTISGSAAVPGLAARYDAVADWYRCWTEGWSGGFVCDPQIGLVADALDGQRWLDVACGAGRTARELAKRRARVTGVDLAARMVGVARAEEAATPLGIRYQVADVARTESWWDGGHFDGAVCEMALMDIDDLEGSVAAIARVLRPGGQFFASLVHPCCPATRSGLSSWPPDGGYQAEGYWTSDDHNPDGVRSRVGSNHRMLGTYLNCLVSAGLVLQEVREPAADVPTYLMLALRRAGRPC